MEPIKLVLFATIILLIGCNKESKTNEIKVERINTIYQDNLIDIYFKNKNIGFIVGGFDFAGNRKSVMLRTIDGGNSWMVDTFNLINKKVEGISGYGDKIFIKITDMINGQKPIFYSNDNGSNWNFYSSNMSILPAFFDENNGISLLSLTILKTADGGNNWDSVYAINSIASLYLNVVSQDVAYVAGGAHHDYTNFGILYKTYNKGITWMNLNWNNSDITNIHFINEEIGYLFTSSGTLFKTLDGGSSFKLVNNNIADLSPGCYFISEMEGFYSASNAIYWTNNGGITWTIQYQDDNININNKIVFNGSGFIIGKNGIILKLTKQP